MSAADTLGALLEIIGLNIVLGGDNAVVIALAAAGLEPQLRKRAVWIGTALAIVVRIVATSVIVALLHLPAIRLVGGLLLWLIAVRLATQGTEPEVKTAGTLGAAIGTIVFADIVMSLDNALAIAGAAHGDVWLVVVGLVISIPIVTLGASLIIRALDHWPWLVWVGGLLIVMTGTGMILAEPFVRRSGLGHALHGGPRSLPVEVLSGLLVLGLTWLWVRHRPQRAIDS